MVNETLIDRVAGVLRDGEEVHAMARAALREVAKYLESAWPDDIPEGDCTCKDCKEFWHGLTPTKVAKHLRAMCEEDRCSNS